MDKEQFKQEIDECLGGVKLTDQMKRNIRKVCYEEKTKKHIRPLRYKKAVGIALTFLLASTSILAVGASNKWNLGLFFNQESINNVADDIQDVKKFDERKNVKMEIEEVVNQGHSAVVIVKFINEGEEKWPQNIECKKFELLVNNKLTDRYIYTHDGVVSADGKELTYCLNIDNEDGLFDGANIELNAENLVTHEETKKEINLPLNQCIVTKMPAPRKGTLEDAIIDKRSSGSQMPILDKAYPAVYLMGIGVDADNSVENKKGVYIRTLSDGYSDSYDIKDAYLRGGIIEVKDTRTGKVYTPKKSEDGIMSGEVDRRFFPGIESKQIPYLVATKASYEKQEVSVYTTWQVEFTIDQNKSIVSWQPKLEIDGLKKYNWGIEIENVYLTSAGVQITGKDKGSYDSRLLKVSLVDQQGKITELGNWRYEKKQNEQYEYDHCILDFKPENMNEDELINTKDIKEVVINGQILSVNK